MTPVKDLVRRAERLSSSLLSDARGGKGLMDSGIRPHSRARALIGPAVTARLCSGNLMVHLGLAAAMPGQVLVLDTGDLKDRACVGGMIVMAMRERKLGGLLIDGLIRDAAELAELDFPVFARGAYPAACAKGGEGEVNRPVICGGVVVNPGDFIFGDADGVIVLPAGQAEAAIAAAEAKKEQEEERIRRITQGDLYPQWVKEAAAALGVAL